LEERRKGGGRDAEIGVGGISITKRQWQHTIIIINAQSKQTNSTNVKVFVLRRLHMYRNKLNDTPYSRLYDDDSPMPHSPHWGNDIHHPSPSLPAWMTTSTRGATYMSTPTPSSFRRQRNGGSDDRT